MCRSHLSQSACILAILALVLAPTVLRAQAPRPTPDAGPVTSPWSGFWRRVDDLAGRFLPAPNRSGVKARTAPVKGDGSTGPSPGDWPCLACSDAGPGMDPNG